MTSLLDSFPLRAEPDQAGPESAPAAPDAAPVADDAPAEVPAPAPLVLLGGDRMTQRDSLLAALANAIRAARHRSKELAEREGGMVAGMLSGQAPSVRAQRRYVSARKWVPPGHDGGTLEGMGLVYGPLGSAVVSLGQSLAAIGAYPLRASIAAGLSLITANVVLWWIHLGIAAIIADLSAAALVALWAGAGYLLMRLTEAHQPARDNETDEI